MDRLRNPKNNRLITIDAKTYNELVAEGYIYNHQTNMHEWPAKSSL